MIYNDILEAVGHTPMIKLRRMVDEDCADIYVKFEGLNVGGSIKTRTAFNMIKAAEREELIKDHAGFGQVGAQKADPSLRCGCQADPRCGGHWCMYR